MTIEKRSLIKRGVPLLLIGLSALVFYLYFFVGMTDIIIILQRADPFYYSQAVAAVLLSMVFYSLTWQHLLNLLSIRTAFQKTFLFTWIGTFVDLLVPAESVSGEISRAYLMSKSSGGDAGKVLASVISHRILSMTITLSGLILGSTFFILRYEASGTVLNFIIIVAIGTFASLVFIFYLCLRKEATEKVLDWTIRLATFVSRDRWRLTGLRFKAQKVLGAFHQGIEILGRRPRSLARPVIFSIAAWFFDLLITFLVFLSLRPAELGFKVSFSAILIVYSISTAIQTVPVGIPGEIGLTEIVMITLYTVLGVPPAISAAATVLIRVLTLWFKLLMGYVAVQWVGIKVLMGSVG